MICYTNFHFNLLIQLDYVDSILNMGSSYLKGSSEVQMQGVPFLYLSIAFYTVIGCQNKKHLVFATVK